MWKIFLDKTFWCVFYKETEYNQSKKTFDRKYTLDKTFIFIKTRLVSFDFNTTNSCKFYIKILNWGKLFDELSDYPVFAAYNLGEKEKFYRKYSICGSWIGGDFISWTFL